MEHRPRIMEYAKERFKGLEGGLLHSMRVYETAKMLSDAYDDEVLYASCLLHDINMDKPHPKMAAEEAKKFLVSIGFPQEKLGRVLHAISEHGFYGNPDSKEAFMLFDADQLDSMGVTGFIQYSGFDNSPHEVSRVLEGIEREGGSILRLKKSRELLVKKTENRKKIISLMRDELGG